MKSQFFFVLRRRWCFNKQTSVNYSVVLRLTVDVSLVEFIVKDRGFEMFWVVVFEFKGGGRLRGGSVKA